MASIAMILFIVDFTATKYNLDPNEPTCINKDVQKLLIQVTTEDLQKKMEKEGLILNVRTIQESIVTEKRDFTYKGKSKYTCSASLEITLNAVEGKSQIRKIISLIPKENLIKTLERNYDIVQNDMGTTYYVSALKIDNTILQELYEDEFREAKNIIAEEERTKALKKEAEEAKKEKEVLCNKSLDWAIKGFIEVEKKYKGEVIDGHIDTVATNNPEFALQSATIIGYRLQTAEKDCQDKNQEIRKQLVELKDKLNSFKMELQSKINKTLPKQLGIHLVSKDDMWSSVLLVGKEESCKILVKAIGGPKGSLMTTSDGCSLLTNSKNIDIVCTQNKTLCKTEDEVLDFANNAVMK